MTMIDNLLPTIEVRDEDRLGVFFFNAIGDHYVTLPTIRALYSLYRERLTIMCLDTSVALFYGEMSHAKIVPIRFLPRNDNIATFDAVEITKSVGRCEILISICRSLTPDIMELFESLNPRVAIGFYSFFDLVLPYDRSVNRLDLMFRFARLWSPSFQISQFSRMPIPPIHIRDLSSRMCSEVTQGHSKKLLVVQADTMPHKLWRPERWKEFLELFLEQHQEYVACVLGMDCSASGFSKHPRVVNKIGEPLEVSLDFVGLADVFIGIDSCMLHAADFGRVPSIGLFGGTTVKEWGPCFTNNICIQGNGSLQEIQSSTVIAAIDELLCLRSMSNVLQTPCNESLLKSEMLHIV